METNTTMTDQHPLTDEICDELADIEDAIEMDSMRAAADWQLEQVVESASTRTLFEGCTFMHFDDPAMTADD